MRCCSRTVPEGAKAARGERQAPCATVECLGEDCRCDSHSREGDPDDGFDRLFVPRTHVPSCSQPMRNFDWSFWPIGVPVTELRLGFLLLG